MGGGKGVHFIKRVKRAGKVFPLLYIRSIIKLWGKGKKMAGKYVPLYIEYIIKEYIRVRKWRER